MICRYPSHSPYRFQCRRFRRLSPKFPIQSIIEHPIELLAVVYNRKPTFLNEAISQDSTMRVPK